MKNSIKVLIVDDDRSSSALIGEVVKRMGFKPIITVKATDGLNIAKLQTVHAAVVDVMLPKMSGVDLTAEFRKTQFGENPVILVSGVFKDKAFAAEAMKKSGAVDFLFKPYAAEDLMNALKKALSGLLFTEKFDLQSLLTRRLTSVRERSKAIEHLEPIKGQDFPFVVSLLMEAGISGNLNLVSDGGEIFGVTLVNGTISEVDSNEAQSTGVLTLIAKGFLAQEDWDAFQNSSGKKKFPLECLVQEGLVSPHAVSVAKHEQILIDFKAIVGSSSMQLNFARQETGDEPPKHAVTMKALMKILSPAMEDFFPSSYLSEFYAPVLQSAMQLTRPTEELADLWDSKFFAPWTGLRQALEKSASMASALKKHPGHEAALYLCLHYLVLSRTVIFDDPAKMQTMTKLLERFTELYFELNGKSPEQVFQYFGGQERPSVSSCEKIYADYIKSNSPDELPEEASPTLKDLARKCFDMVTAANAVMTDDAQRQELFESLKNEGVMRLRRSNELVAQALNVLRKGQFAEALELCLQAETNQPTTLQFLIRTWAEVKSGALSGKALLVERARRLDSLTVDEKKSAYYHMAQGVVKRAMGDPNANTSFEKVLQIDSAFSEARRELNAVTPAKMKDRKIDILNGDLTDIVSQLFRRKAE